MERFGPFGVLVVLALAVPDGAAAAPVYRTRHHVSPVPQAADAQPVYRETKDWILACDNIRACTAKFVPDEMSLGALEGDPGYLEIARDAGPAGSLAVTLQGDTHAPDPSTFRLDGKPLSGTYGWQADNTRLTTTLMGDDALRFVREIKSGAKLTYSPADGAPHISLNGLSETLAAMDEDQGRQDGQTAFVRVGDKPASDVPPPVPLPVVQAAPPLQLLPDAAAFAATVRRGQDALLASHACSPDMTRADEAFALNQAEALVLIGCMQGAYQSTVLLFRAPRDAPLKARQVILPPQPTADPQALQAQGGAYMGESGWDPRTATFTESAKGRGLADCGASTTWVFDGRDFHLSAFHAQTRCGGPPSDWPVLYRAQVVTLR